MNGAVFSNYAIITQSSRASPVNDNNESGPCSCVPCDVHRALLLPLLIHFIADSVVGIDVSMPCVGKPGEHSTVLCGACVDRL